MTHELALQKENLLYIEEQVHQLVGLMDTDEPNSALTLMRGFSLLSEGVEMVDVISTLVDSDPFIDTASLEEALSLFGDNQISPGIAGVVSLGMFGAQYEILDMVPFGDAEVYIMFTPFPTREFEVLLLPDFSIQIDMLKDTDIDMSQFEETIYDNIISDEERFLKGGWHILETTGITGESTIGISDKEFDIDQDPEAKSYGIKINAYQTNSGSKHLRIYLKDHSTISVTDLEDTKRNVFEKIDEMLSIIKLIGETQAVKDLL